MRPISARIGVVTRFVIPGLARFILHNNDCARKHFFDTELWGLLEAVRYKPQDSFR
jgi:hypothetical protein